MARIVCRHPAVQKRQGCTNAVGQVVSNQLAGLVVVGQERHQCSSQDAGKQQGDNIQPSLVEPAGQIRGDQDGHHAASTGRDLQQSRLLAVVSKPFDKRRLERGHGAVRHRTRNRDQAQQPGLGVQETLDCLTGLKMLVLDSGLVFAQAFNGPDLFLVGEARGHWVVGEH